MRLLEADAQELTGRLEAVADKQTELEDAKRDALGPRKCLRRGYYSQSSRPRWRKFYKNVQLYWNATLVGPDVRKFLVHFLEILIQVPKKLNEAEGAALIKKHARVLRPLAVVSALTRTTERLAELQMAALEGACAEFRGAYRESYE